jgi:hypothetical protein
VQQPVPYQPLRLTRRTPAALARLYATEKRDTMAKMSDYEQRVGALIADKK